MISLLLCVFFVTTILVKYFMHMRRMERYVKHLKTKGTVYPFIGNAHVLVGKSDVELFKGVMQFAREVGTPFKTYIGPLLFVILDKPEDMKTIFTSPHCLDKPYVYGYMPNTNGILNARYGSIWKPIRKLMNPAFHLKVLQASMPIFNDETKTLIQKLNARVGDADFDILPLMNFITLRIICGAAMGVDSMSDDDIGKFLHSMEIVFEMVIKRFTTVWTQPDFIYRWTSMCRKQKQNVDIIRNFTNRVFDQKKSEYLTRMDKSPGYSNESDKPHLELIDHLLESYFAGRCSENMIKEQIETILMTGSDTTSITASFAILMLAMHPKFQERLFEELKSVYDTQDGATLFDHLTRLPYLDCCLKETMRLFPVAPVIGRTPAIDIPVSNCTIPKGTTIKLSILTLHRRKDIWGDDVDEFNPDHFSPKNVSQRHPYSFLPFSAGPRQCIGNQQSMILMKVMLSACVRNFKFSTRLKMCDLVLKSDITMKLINKHMVFVERRDW
ncbi:cytochrome P450 4C1-like [Sitodiplosis mosellana]|uniref:cytochrome P450 4C1-like n=1 Tax=Sitodiplosis mosellana TaxID=263140 RepID=UPI0024438FA8|nr:cytochrome P450 4C1-like [Sitodiplosis mosellana]